MCVKYLCKFCISILVFFPHSSFFFCAVLGLCLVIVAMSFSLDNPGFSASAEISQVPPATPPLPPSTGSTSSYAPSSGDSSACRNCPKCCGRMSKPVFDCHTVCVICRGVECSLDSHFDECLEWSLEEMESYLKHRQALLRKDHHRKDSLFKPPSSPVTSPSPSPAGFF